ncbi:DUF58 domain-containing protein [Kitasatospora camelliae]|uniref:DUF58 domain-containing protein n=1 Tax=Kitasatospora camelliae TaxID=3156397 RepID=A0AAU8K885_9ACTN
MSGTESAAAPTRSPSLLGPASDLPVPPAAGVRATARALRLLTVAAVAVAAALVGGQPWLLAVAAGPVVLLALAAPGGSRPRGVTASAEVGPRRCFEGETVTARIELAFEGTAGWIDPAVHLGPGVELRSRTVTGPVVELALTVPRWGRLALGVVDVDVHDGGGLTRRTVRVDLGEASVFPVPTAAGLTPVPVRLPARIGEHTARQRGDGVEVVGVRPHVWGERQRRIHWPSTTRRGSVQVNQFAAERAADTVVLVDALADFRSPATGVSSLDETVRAAAGIARAYLRSHDRVGVVSVGGTTRWLRPGTGHGYFYRIVETVLDAREPGVRRPPRLDRLPAPVLPPDALVFALTPLADQRILDLLGELTARGNPLVVIEVPIGDPVIEPDDRDGLLALGLWRADREVMRAALRRRGIPVVGHRPGESLDLALAPLLRTRVPGRSR